MTMGEPATNLATRCPACGTVFRVTQAQLRESEGWVRCGRCNGVFNAAEVMFDVDSGAAVPLDGPPVAAGLLPAGFPVGSPAGSPAGWSAGLPADLPADLPAEAGADEAPLVTDWQGPAATPAAASTPAEPAWPGHLAADSDSAPGRQEPRFDSAAAWAPPGAGLSQREEPLLRTASALPDDGSGLGGPAWPALADPAPDAAGAAARHTATPGTPSFLRAAEQAALWRRPAVRTALGAAVVGLGLALAAQAAVLWRDTLAAHLPASAPALHALCRLAGCQVQPLRRLDALAVASSGLSRLDGSTLYRLQLVLHNRADTAVLMPALDLSVHDAQGKLVSRRVLQMADLGAPQATLAAGQELPIKVLMSAGEQRIDGYTVELFYP